MQLSEACRCKPNTLAFPDTSTYSSMYTCIFSYLEQQHWHRFKWKPAAQRWYTAEGLVFDTINNNLKRQSHAVWGEWTPWSLSGWKLYVESNFQPCMFNMLQNWMFSWSPNVATRRRQAHNQEKFLRPLLELIYNFGAMFRKSALPNTAWDHFQSDSCSSCCL